MQIFAVGHVKKDGGRTYLDIHESFVPALKELAHFSHIHVLWWCHRVQNDRLRRMTQCNPPYENAPRTGVFASRSPVRPNPIGLTTARVLDVDREAGVIEIADIDAYDQTPILDVKPYLPPCDRVERPRVPEWLAHWPEWLPEAGESEGADAHNLHLADVDRLAAFQVARPAPRPTAPPVAEAAIPAEPGDGPADPGDIVIRGARQHNLKDIDVTIPRKKFTVVTGVSGSGKSSLAFDTLYAEGRRRYMDSLSTLARRLLGQMEKPEVDHIHGLHPTIAIEQRAISRNPRSTVGTITEVYDHLRLLFARVGTRHCPRCGRAVKPQTARQMADNLAALAPGTWFRLSAPDQGGDGDAHVVPGEDTLLQDTSAQDTFRKRLEDSVQTALQAGNGRLAVTLESGEDLLFSQHLECPHCGIVFFELTPALFSFNNPDGMCPGCNGLGVEISVDLTLIVTQPHLSLLDGASPWWGDLRQYRQQPTGNWMRNEVLALAEAWKIDLELPWNELPERFRHAVLYGAGDEIFRFAYQSPRGRSGEIARPVAGVVNHINRLLHQTSSETVRRNLMQFMSEQPCSACQGERLCPEARLVAIGSMRFPEVATMTVTQAHRWITDLPSELAPAQLSIAGEILAALRARLGSMLNVGLHYLSLDRPAPTLSGGEGQRIRLATQLGCGLTGILYVLDEPSIGLHPRDHRSLLDTLRRLRDAGNTVLVVEHDADTMRAADWLIDLGPGAGMMGGELIAAGTPDAVMADPASLTGRYLRGDLQVAAPNGRQRRAPTGWLTVVGARLHNLKNIDVAFPLGVLTCVTGVSGSGKSSLVAQTLSPALSQALHGAQGVPGPHDCIEGLAQVDKVINVTQAPIGRTPRSNPGTYVEVFDEIRKVFAQTPEARARNYKAGRFSFNSKEGRCAACRGHGRRRVEMHFMPDVWVTCAECVGQRFNRQTLEVKYRFKSVADVLDMDVQEALDFFARDGENPRQRAKITRILHTLCDVGLGYLKLGQSALTLSGGEAQRIKLAKELGRADTGRTVYLLDEPTTGLHFADIQKLLDVLHRLADAGNTIVVVEHNLDVIRTADWIIDLGPEGGDAGGTLVAQGQPEQVAQVAESHTGRFLQASLVETKSSLRKTTN